MGEERYITKYANDLIELAEIELRQGGAQKIDIKQGIQINEEGNETLYIRPDAATLWDEVFNHCLTNELSHFIVTGNPGIGKSRSMTYLLRKLLLAGKLVIYELRKENSVLKFVPCNGQYCVFTQQIQERLRIPELHDRNTFYLIDPSTPQPILTRRAHTILVAPPNTQHYHEFAKEPRVFVMCMPPWNFEDLLDMFNDMKQKRQTTLTEEELVSRFNKFGGRPRLIFDITSTYDARLVTELARLSHNTIANVLSYSSYPLSHISDILFVLHVTPNLSNPFKLSYAYTPKTTATFASEYIRWQVLLRFWDTVMNYFSNERLYDCNRIALGHLVKEVLKYAIVVGGNFQCKSLDNDKSFVLQLAPGQHIVSVKNWTSYMDDCLQLNAAPRAVLMSSVNNPIIEAMDTPFRAYQFTSATKPSIDVEQIAPLLKGNQTLQIYYVVPHKQFDSFQRATIDGHSSTIEQYVVSIPFPIDNDQKAKILEYWNNLDCSSHTLKLNSLKH